MITVVMQCTKTLCRCHTLALNKQTRLLRDWSKKNKEQKPKARLEDKRDRKANVSR